MSRGNFSFDFSDAFDPIRLEYEESLLWSGEALTDGYGWGKQSSAARIGSVKGRARFMLVDPHTPVQMQVNMHLSDTDFNEWQSYWAAVTDYGRKPFPMRLMLDSASAYQDLPEGYFVQPIGPYDARSQGPDHWKVSLAVEIPQTPNFRVLECNIVYGGPLDDLAGDHIYGGPIEYFDIAEIYGGPLNAVAVDDVYGGPSDDLAADIIGIDFGTIPLDPPGIIAPCKGVLNV